MQPETFNAFLDRFKNSIRLEAASELIKYLDQHRLLSRVGKATSIDGRTLYEAHERYTKERI